MPGLTAQDIIRMLGLKPHPEGGHFRETFRDAAQLADGRATSTAAYYLLARGERSHWHRLDAAEIWHWYAGAPLQLEVATAPGRIEHLTLGGEISAGLRPQAVVPANTWQAAETTGDWTLVGCTLAPGFDFARHEMAPPDWSPEKVGE